MNYITFYEKYRKASPDGGEYTYCIPEQSDTPEAKLKEQLSENYFNGKEGRINFAADTANYLTGFIVRVLELENE